MPIKKDKKKKTTNKRSERKKKTAKPKVVYIMTQKLPKEKCCTDVKKTGEAYTVPIGFADLAGTRRLGTEKVETKKVETKTTPFKEEIKIDKLIPLGRLKLDENIINKLNASRPSIPAKNDTPDVPAFQRKPINEYFIPSLEVVVPPKKDSKVKKFVTSIEMRKMGQEDALAQQIRKDEATIQRQQKALNYYNTQMPLYSSQDLLPEKDISVKFAYDDEPRLKPLIQMTPQEMLRRGKEEYEKETERRLRAELQPSLEEIVRTPEKRKYVKSGKYSKKKPEENISFSIEEEE